MASEKPQFSPDTIEFNHEESSVRTLRKSSMLDSVRQGLTLLTFLVAVSIVGMSGNALLVYNQTHVARDFYLPLWPYNFNLSPNIALVAGASVATLCDVVSLAGSKILVFRSRFLLHTVVSILAPLAGLIAAIVATAFFYSINTSTTTDTLQSWSCRFSDVEMTTAPHFDVLCREAQAALYMMIALIPLQLIVFGLASYAFYNEKKPVAVDRKSSPVMS